MRGASFHNDRRPWRECACLRFDALATDNQPTTNIGGLAMSRLVRRGILVLVLGLVAYPVLSGHGAIASSLNVVTRTKNQEELTGTMVNGQLSIRLKNNHAKTITAFAINFGDTTIREDFAYSDVRPGIEPGATYEASYSVSLPPEGSQPSTLYLLAVLLPDATTDGNSNVAQSIRDERLGEKVQLRRALRLMEQARISQSQLGALKADLAAALDTDDSQTLVALSELQPPGRSDRHLSDGLRDGLRVGRQKVLQTLEALEQLPPDYREKGLLEFKAQASTLFENL